MQKAYRFLDQGENARAIALLTDYLKEPGHEADSEARVLIASAYLGQVGIDVYSLHDTFKDVVFGKPLNQTLLMPKLTPNLRTKPGAPDPVAEKNPPTLTEKLIANLDSLLVGLREAVVFLNRFPRVDSQQWPLLDDALAQLDVKQPTRDIRVYRVFIRIIYLKAFLGERVVGDPDFGSTKWLCRLDVQHFRDDLEWVLGEMHQALRDAQSGFARPAESLSAYQGVISGVLLWMNDVESITPAGTGTGTMALQNLIRREMGCERFAD